MEPVGGQKVSQGSQFAFQRGLGEPVLPRVAQEGGTGVLKGAKREPKGAQGREKGGQELSKRGPGEPGERPKESRSEESKSQEFFTERNVHMQKTPRKLQPN
jgi:hypothetical protein